jgi:hypothetical protein
VRRLIPILALVFPSVRAQEIPPPEAWQAEGPASPGGGELVTGGVELTVGAGQDPVALASGPLVLTSLSTNCPVLFVLESPTPPYEVYVYTSIGLYIPEGSTLVVTDGLGLCTGTILWSGYRP